jgi:hypothetical protein
MLEERPPSSYRFFLALEAFPHGKLGSVLGAERWGRSDMYPSCSAKQL